MAIIKTTNITMAAIDNAILRTYLDESEKDLMFHCRTSKLIF